MLDLLALGVAGAGPDLHRQQQRPDKDEDHAAQKPPLIAGQLLPGDLGVDLQQAYRDPADP